MEYRWVTNETYGIKLYKPYECWQFEEAVGAKMESYRDFFYSYGQFSKIIEDFIAQNGR